MRLPAAIIALCLIVVGGCSSTHRSSSRPDRLTRAPVGPLIAQITKQLVDEEPVGVLTPFYCLMEGHGRDSTYCYTSEHLCDFITDSDDFVSEPIPVKKYRCNPQKRAACFTYYNVMKSLDHIECHATFSECSRSARIRHSNHDPNDYRETSRCVWVPKAP
jgi:hypothetical protein